MGHPNSTTVIGGWVGGDFEAEAGEFALLHAVIDKEADADGEWNETTGGYGENFAVLDDCRKQEAKEDDTDANGDQNDARAACIGETTQRVFRLCTILSAVSFGGLQQLFDLLYRHTALHHGHALLGLDTAFLNRADHLYNSRDGQPSEDRDWNYVWTPRFTEHDIFSLLPALD